MNRISFLAIALLWPFLFGCVSTAQITTEVPLYKYRADMRITIDGVTSTGMAIGEIGTKDIAIVSQAPLDLLRITTCHRDFTIQKVDQGWFGGSGKSYTYHYEPSDEERDGTCPLYIEAYSKDLVTDWGFVVFRNNENLTAIVECNGSTASYRGVSVCQVKAGLNQVVRFNQVVKFAAEKSCHVETKDNKEFVIKGDMGFCRMEFSPEGVIFHRFIMLGYDKVLIR